jgi:hypothetical protein
MVYAATQTYTPPIRQSDTLIIPSVDVNMHTLRMILALDRLNVKTDDRVLMWNVSATQRTCGYSLHAFAAIEDVPYGTPL